MADPSLAIPDTTELHKTFEWVKRRSSPPRGYKFGYVRSYMDDHCPGVRLPIWVCLICIISPYSNGAVQIWFWV